MARKTQPITINDRTFEIGKLSLGALRREADAVATVMSLRPAAADVPVMPPGQQLGAIIVVVHAAIVSGCVADGGASPPTQDEFIAFCDALDYDTGLRALVELVPVVMDSSGFKKLAEGAQPGESTGAASST